MKIYIVRHGETMANVKGLMQGQSESELTDTGKLLAVETGKGLANIKFDAAFSSPLRRTKATIKLILKENNNSIPNIIYDDRLKEINLGLWEMKGFSGKNPDIDPALIKSFFTDPFSFGNPYQGESTTEVISRTKDFLNSLAKENYENVLVVSHGYAIRAMLNFLYANPSDFWQGKIPYNCCVNIIEFKNDEFKFIAKDKIYYDPNILVDHYKIR